MISYKNIYDQEALEKDIEANCGRPYQQCAISVMDTIADPNITFDENGICNYYYEYKNLERERVFNGNDGKKKLTEMVKLIKNESKGNKYDCIVGLSGGLDSSYLAYLAKDLKLNPLLVHFDYGWNLEAAVQNIEKLVKNLGFDLYTYVINWEEFKDLLRAYCKASVLDLDVPADHLIFASLNNVAKKHNIKYILKGYNITTEAILPLTWNYNRKFDLVNLKNIHRRFGSRPINSIPKLGLIQQLYFKYIFRVKSASPLNYVSYNKNEVQKLLVEEMEWKEYGGKHSENIFTRFYQGYILPKKFNIDKRKAHFSTLIFSGQLNKEEAIKLLKEPAYSIEMMNEDKDYIAKKLSFSIDEFNSLINSKNISHEFYGDGHKIENIVKYIERILYKIIKIVKNNESSK